MNLNDDKSITEIVRLSEQLLYQLRDALQSIVILHEKCLSFDMPQLDSWVQVLDYVMRLEKDLRMVNDQANDIIYILGVLEKQIRTMQQVYGPPPFNQSIST